MLSPEEKIKPKQVSNPRSSLESTGTSLTTDLATQQTKPKPTTLSSQELNNLESFWNLVRREFRNQPEVMNGFVDMCKEFKGGRIDRHEFRQLASNLFRGHREIIINFNRVFPIYRRDPDQQEPVSISGSSMELTGTSPTLPSQQRMTNALTASSLQTTHLTSPPTTSSLKTTHRTNPPTASSQQTTHRTNPPTAGSSLGSTATSLTLSTQQAMPNPPTLSSQELKDMESFWNQVKREFRNQPEVITAFLNMIKEFKLGRIDQPEIMQLASNLFRGHREISERLNRLFPEYRINPDQRDQVSISGTSLGSTGTSLTLSAQQRMANPQNEYSAELNNMLSFWNRVKRELRNQPEVITDFVNMCEEFKRGRIDRPEFMQLASNLFRCHREISESFNKAFLSKYRIDPDQVSISGSSVGSTETSLTLSTQQAMSNPQNESSEEFRKQSMFFIDQVKYAFRNQPEAFSDFLALSKELYPETETFSQILQRLSNLLRGHPELTVGFNEFLPSLYKIDVEYDEEMQVDEGSLILSTEASPTSRSTTQTTVNPLTASSTCSAESSSVQSFVAQSSASESSSTESSGLQSAGSE